MDYRDEVFLTVAENLSFSKAAEELYISQPAVTKHIKELESKLEAALFERKGNKVYLTQAGKLVYRQLKQIRQQYHEMAFELGRLNQAYKGNLRIGASSTIAQYLIPEVLAAFHRRFPDIKLDLLNGNSQEMEQKLLNQEIELALVENDSSQTNIRYQSFLGDEIVVVTGSQSVYGKRKTLAVTDLQQIPLVLRERGSGTLEVIRHALIRHNLTLDSLNILIHLGSTEAIKNFLTNFDGIAFVSEKSIEKELLLKSMVKLQVKGLHIPRQFRIASRLGHENNTQQLFQNFLLQYNF
ncbi:LysR substrate-binding domain-containing protein [Sunxiuqinia elliptica]|uniref:DNA-binding transcriptional LysR family regulator n=1 Tax=Sunxiuqinia elliptica TaxID=655355 RepID=A0A4R6H575_9BACT|nr:LysR substrate-binding domain-containing protein [Sunxiuqinia elliptica]TDO02586.1 DNA-binding transcriptional LysR family regulator [Sunxiuqinia elliptica]TDO58676.1 DNA-binding transcriptional LysR family regulator [Sunxiuqinia elliptica]